MSDTADELQITFEYDATRALKLEKREVDFDPREEYEGFVLGPSPDGRRWEIKVLSIGNWPEFKTETCYKKVHIPLDGWTKVSYPCAWHRTCNKAWYLTIAYSGTTDLPEKIEEIIQDCTRIALIPALPLLLTGNPAAAAAAFLEAFKTCLIQKGIKELSGWKVGFDSRKTCGDWHRV